MPPPYSRADIKNCINAHTGDPTET